jgi:hypothetical protein
MIKVIGYSLKVKGNWLQWLRIVACVSIIFTFQFSIFNSAQAQAPKRFNYQAVVRDANGRLVENGNLPIRITIRQGNANGPVVYTENTTVTTNSFGLFSLEVGSNADLGIVDWGNGPFFLQSEVQLTAGAMFNIVTNQQLVSVPYALYAGIADSVRGVPFEESQVLWMSNDTIFLTGGSFVVLPPDFDGDYNHLTNKPTNISQFNNDAGYITGEVQVLSISNDTIFLTGGSFVKLPAGFDGDYNSLTNRPSTLSAFTNDMGYITEEVQVLSLGNDTIYLTGGSYVVIPDYTEMQTLADVVALGNSAGGEQLKNLLDPTDPQDAVTKHYIDSIWALLVETPDANYSTHNVTQVDVCDSFYWHGAYYSLTGTYTYAYSNTGGFYSVDTLKLYVRVGTHNVEDVTANGTYTWHDTLYTASGTYVYNYLNLYGCPSVDTMHLTLHAGSADCTTIRFENDTSQLNACGHVSWYGADIRSSGMYEHSLGNIAFGGCDSVVRVQVMILPMFHGDTSARTATGVTWRGNNYTVTGDYNDTLTAVNGCDSIYTLHLVIGSNSGVGSIPGLFSISNGEYVRFASGNLQYLSSDMFWRFAENQYEVINNPCAAAYYPTWSDVFGWGTSGYHNPADPLNINYQPFDHSTNSATPGTDAYTYNQYGYGPSLNMADTNLTGSSASYDWGQYNNIANGGFEEGLWRLLSNDEWDYLLNQRNNASYLRSIGQITGIPTGNGGTTTIQGYIVLADDGNANLPAGVTFTPNATSYYTNSYTLAQWEALEDTGALFLPAGYYWTSTSGGTGSAYCLAINGTTVLRAPYNRSNQNYVRLAQAYDPNAMTCNCTYYDTTIISSGPFSWHSYTYTETGDYMEAITNAAGCDSIISLSLIIEDPGVLPGYFSVSATHQVRFSKGNLQYKASNDVWRFGHHQYDYRGADNNKRSATYTGWIDQFPWATSGYHDSTDFLNTYYLPYSPSYGNYGPSEHMADWDLVNTSAQYDWGVHNPIANGGNTPGQWRTLTIDEWNYLLYERTNNYNLRGWATVNGVRGMILLPDNWSLPAGITFTSSGNNFLMNIYGVTQWATMEAAGAVFLPSTGTTAESTYSANYWSSTTSRSGVFHAWSSSANYFYWNINTMSSDPGYYIYSNYSNSPKYSRFFVRLVKD